MRIFFIGTVNFSNKMLQELIRLKANVVGIATKSASAFNADHEDLSPIAKENGIDWKYVKDINAPHILEWIKNLNPDVVFCFGWSSLIKNDLLNLPPLGVVGYHPTELPKNRGRHPVIWSLVLGLEKSASTFFFMEDGADDGNIISQELFEISYDDDAASIQSRLEKTATHQLSDFLPALQSGNFKSVPQDHSESNIWRKRTPDDGKIDFRMSSRAIYNLVRGLTRPYVGAHLNYQDKEVKIWKVREEACEMQNIEPGKILKCENNEVLVKTDGGAIRILEHGFEFLPKENEYL